VIGSPSSADCDKARFVGEPVALIVAETVDQAKDAAGQLEIAYEPLPAVLRVADAVKLGAPPCGMMRRIISASPIAKSVSSRSPRPPFARKDLPEDLQGLLAGISDQTLPVASFPYGTQVCEVEVDPETGEIEIVRYAAVDDVGRAINPLILHGQTHGGIAQGGGQALLENSYYDSQSGQLLAASFMDYAMPRAETLPFLATALSEVPTPTNRLGVRSGGEGGTTPALAAVINAIVDALAELGVHHIEMPATPERVWHAIRAAAARRM
jgi:CO/xanthine dehydrogenase Mo-binding subunit